MRRHRAWRSFQTLQSFPQCRPPQGDGLFLCMSISICFSPLSPLPPSLSLPAFSNHLCGLCPFLTVFLSSHTLLLSLSLVNLNGALLRTSTSEYLQKSLLDSIRLPLWVMWSQLLVSGPCPLGSRGVLILLPWRHLLQRRGPK